MIPRASLKPGQVGVVRHPADHDVVDDGITFLTWGQSKSPEVDHIFMVYGAEEIVEQYWPCSRKRPMTDYDARYDLGQVAILEPTFWTPEYAARIQAWWDLHLGMPYGLDDIGMFAEDGLLWRVWPWMGAQIKKRDLPEGWEKSIVCSQAAELALEYGKEDENLFRAVGIGRGRAVPGDFLTLPFLRVALDLKH